MLDVIHLSNSPLQVNMPSAGFCILRIVCVLQTKVCSAGQSEGTEKYCSI